MTNKELLQYCRLYRGENDIDDNPIDKDQDEFKWLMWRVEFSIVRSARKDNIADEQYEEFFKDFIRNQIDVYASAPFGGDPRPYYDKYFAF